MIRDAVMRRALPGFISGSLALAGCATTPVLKPAPGDTLVSGMPNVAQAEAAGVRVLVAGDVWKGDPSNLGELFTPVQVTIENHSGKAVRVSYPDFKLSGSSGFVYAAIPPMSAKGVISQVEPGQRTASVRLASYEPETTSNRSGRIELARWEHRYDHDRFFVAPHFSPFYPAWGVWPYAYPYDPFYYDTLYTYWPERLPTQDMLSQALPEGVVQDGGRIVGFVYFQGVGKRESSVTFSMGLVDATNGQSFGQASIPFSVSR
jgi:hypothetical protein